MFKAVLPKSRALWKSFFESSEGSWSTFWGAGMEYAIGVGAAVRLEALYEPNTSFKVKDIPNLTYDASFVSVNLGIAIYL